MPLEYAPFTFSYDGYFFADGYQGFLSLSLVTASDEIPSGGSGWREFDYKRYKASPDFAVLKADANLEWQLKNWVLAGKVRGQAASGPLISNEQFAVGGAGSVRGYLAAEQAADDGYLASLELRTPSLDGWFGNPWRLLRFHVFGEGAQLQLRDPLPEQEARFDLASVGVGARAELWDYVSGSVDLGYPLAETGDTEKYDPECISALPRAFERRAMKTLTTTDPIAFFGVPDHATTFTHPHSLLPGALAPALAQAWWQEDWSYRKQITVDTTQEGAAITERVGRVPVLIRLHTGNFSFDGVKENGADLRFVLGDDETVLNHRIESFDALLGVAYIWVDVPEIQGGARQDIWMYYGNPQAPLPDSNQVFDADYAGVYHFDGAPGGSADDATAYNNDSTNPVPGTTAGVIAQAAQFSGEPLMLPASPSLAVTAGGVFSFSAWIKAPQAAGEQLLYARRQGGNALLIGIANGVPFVEVNGQRSERVSPWPPINGSTWR